jgi:selenocysteine-specific elongation factor
LGAEAGAAQPRAQRAAQLVLGTAGHIDHGKTALVRALTGVDTDRLPEEKSRGITIDLGFAPLELPDGTRLSVVDVPGHEGLVRTMVAGANGIDLLLLVVAADEGVMPQTREHLAICELLGLTRAVVALTKTDLVDGEMAELAAEEVALLLEETPLGGAPVVPVSSQTGEGLDRLREALARMAAEAPPRTPRQGPPRLAIDRAFEMRGFGGVVTGTLIGGPLDVGDTLELYPEGKRGRVRGLQSHGVARERCEPGVRCAVNLQGLSLSELSRGRVLAPPGSLAPTRTLDVLLLWLPVAPSAEEPVAVSFLAGTCERRARAAPIGRERLAPGSQGFARIHIDGDPVALLPGDRFILRGFARTEMGGATLGGGLVLDVAPPHRRRSDPALLRDLEALALRDPRLDLRVRVERAGYAGCERGVLARETGCSGDELDAAIAAAGEQLLATRGGRYVASDAVAALERELLAALAAYHEAEPLRPGMPTGTLRGRLPGNVPAEVCELAIERLAAAGAIAIAADHVRATDHAVALDPESEVRVARILELLKATGLEAPSLRDLAAAVGSPPQALRDLLAHLERQGRLVRAPGDLWFEASAVEALRQRMREHFAQHDTLDTQTYKSLIGTTRRTAVPLMELLDSERFTQRRGEVRILRG